MTSFLSVAALFLLRHAEFVAVVQVFVYGGGIMVLFPVRHHAGQPAPAQGDLQHVHGTLLVAGLLVGPGPGVVLFGFAFLRVDFVPVSRRRGVHRPSRARTGNSEAVAWSALPRLPAAVRDRIGLPAGGDGRRGRSGEAEQLTVLEITTGHYLVLSFVLFGSASFGIVVRRNMITVLMSIELVLNSVNLNLIAFSPTSCRI